MTALYPEVTYPQVTYPGDTFTSSTPAPLVPRGLATRLVAYTPNGAALSVLPEPLSYEATVAHNDVSSLRVTYSATAAAGTHVMRPITTGTEIAVQAWDGSGWVEPDGCRFVVVGRDKDEIEHEGGMVAVVNLTCVGWAWMASKVRSTRTDVLVTDTNADQVGKRPWLSASAGLIVASLLNEHATAGGMTWTKTFGSAVDSAGAAWAKVTTLYTEHLIRLDVLLENLAASGMCDWTTRGRALYLTNPDTALSPDLAGSVILRLGTHVTLAPSSETIEELVSDVVFEGGAGLRVSRNEPSAPTPWGRWFGGLSNDSVTTDGSAQSLMQGELARAGRVRGQYVRDLTPVQPAGTPLPLVSYGPGAWVSAPGAAGLERMRVQQVVLRYDGDSTTVGLVLNDVLLDAEQRRAKRTVGIVGGSSSTGGSTVRPAGPDRRTPAAPQGLVVSSNAYTDKAGIPRALVTATWTQVTTARTSDGGGTMEIAYYELHRRDNVAGAPWKGVTSSDDTTVDFSPLPTGTAMQWRVRARGRYATSPGNWSNIVTMTTAVDDIPPPAPSQLVLTTRLGVITATWDGLTATGTEMPADFARVEVSMRTVTTVNPTYLSVVDSLRAKGSIYVTGQTYGAARFFRSRAVDRAGNKSEWSPEVSIAAVALVNADAIGKVISGAKIIDGTITASDAIIGNTITGALIQGLAVKAVHLDANEVWANNAWIGHARTQVLTVGAVSPKMLAGGMDEMAPNPMWNDLDKRTVYPLPTGWEYSPFQLRRGQTEALRVNGDQVSNGSRYVFSPEMPVKPGEKWFLEMVVNNTLAPDFAVAYQVQGRDTTGAIVNAPVRIDTGLNVPGATALNLVLTIPDGWVTARLTFVVTGTPTTGRWYVSEVSARRAMSSETTAGEGIEITPRGIKGWESSGEKTLDIGNGTYNLISGQLRTNVGANPAIVLKNSSVINELPAIWFSIDGSTDLNQPRIFTQGVGNNEMLILNSGKHRVTGIYAGVRVDRGLDIYNGFLSPDYAFRIGRDDQTLPNWHFAILGNGDIDMRLEHDTPHRRVFIPENGGIEWWGRNAFAASPIYYGGIVTRNATRYFQMRPVYDATNTAAANVYVSSTGTMQRSSSLRALKADIRPVGEGWALVKGLEPVSFRDRGEVERGESPMTQVGFIAEQVQATGAPGMATYDEHGALLGVQYARLPALHHLWLQQIDRRLTALEAT